MSLGIEDEHGKEVAIPLLPRKRREAVAVQRPVGLANHAQPDGSNVCAHAYAHARPNCATSRQGSDSENPGQPVSLTGSDQQQRAAATAGASVSASDKSESLRVEYEVVRAGAEW